MRLGYQWNLDFASLLNLTLQHNYYVLVMIEHFSKWLELMPLPDCSSEGVWICILGQNVQQVWCSNSSSHQPRYKISRGFPRFVWKNIDRPLDYWKIIMTQTGWPNKWWKRWSEDCKSTAFKKATLNIGICSYHGWPWDISLVGRPHWHFFHGIFCYLVEISSYHLYSMRCYDYD